MIFDAVSCSFQLVLPGEVQLILGPADKSVIKSLGTADEKHVYPLI